MNPFLSREQLASSVGKIERIELPELGGHVYLRMLTLAQISVGEEVEGVEGEESGDRMLYQIAMSMCDPDGNRLWEDDPDAGAATIKEMPFPAVDRLMKAVLNLNGLWNASVEDAEGN